MKITYIHHSSFAVELESAVFLFDYCEGPLPEFPADKTLFVLASHFHGDHFSPVIFELAEQREMETNQGGRAGGQTGAIRYILSKDIGVKRVPEKYRDLVCFVKAGEQLELAAGAEPAGRIETFKSTDEGVAFWITWEGKEIYHAGDLNNWWWEGEDKAWNHNMAANYKREMEKMAGRHADAAFVPLDPRQEQWFYLGMQGFMEKVDAKCVFPMHFWKDYSIIEAMKKHPASEGFRDRIMTICREGEEFIL